MIFDFIILRNGLPIYTINFDKDKGISYDKKKFTLISGFFSAISTLLDSVKNIGDVDEIQMSSNVYFTFKRYPIKEGELLFVLTADKETPRSVRKGIIKDVSQEFIRRYESEISDTWKGRFSHEELFNNIALKIMRDHIRRYKQKQKQAHLLQLRREQLHQLSKNREALIMTDTNLVRKENINRTEFFSSIDWHKNIQDNLKSLEISMELSNKKERESVGHNKKLERITEHRKDGTKLLDSKRFMRNYLSRELFKQNLRYLQNEPKENNSDKRIGIEGLQQTTSSPLISHSLEYASEYDVSPISPTPYNMNGINNDAENMKMTHKIDLNRKATLMMKTTGEMQNTSELYRTILRGFNIRSHGFYENMGNKISPSSERHKIFLKIPRKTISAARGFKSYMANEQLRQLFNAIDGKTNIYTIARKLHIAPLKVLQACQLMKKYQYIDF